MLIWLKRVCEPLHQEEEGSATFWIHGLCHSMLRLYFRYRVYHAVFCTTHSPVICCFTGAPILLRRCICRECAHAEASESRYIRLRGRARQAETRRTESRYYERRIRVSSSGGSTDISTRSRAQRERRPKLADRIGASGELMGRLRSVVQINYWLKEKEKREEEEKRFGVSVVYKILGIICRKKVPR